MAEKTGNIDKIIDQIGNLSVLELSKLVKSLQDKFGVSQMAFSASQTTTATASEEKPAQEVKSTATVVLTDAGTNKIAVIKALRGIKPELGLKEAKDITEATPKEILSNVKMEEANVAREKLEAAGATVELK